MPKFLPEAVQFGPDDVTSAELRFYLGQIGWVELKIPDGDGESGKFIRDLYRTAIDTYGPGGSNPPDSVSFEIVERKNLV